MATTVTQEEARQVLYYFGHPQGWQPGSFVEKLLSAIANADSGNRARLSLGFPGLVAAMDVAQYQMGGIDELVKIAENKR